MEKIILNTPTPLTAHVLINSGCNLSCKNCYYKNNDGMLSLNTIKKLFNEWKGQIRSVAIGGGEPLLHQDIDEIVTISKKYFYTAITTNGTLKHSFTCAPDRIHVSCDSMHDNIKECTEAINFYSEKSTVGINHILTSIEELKEIDRYLGEKIDKITILLMKPHSSFNQWKSLYQYISRDRERYWLDACLQRKIKGIPCRQGITSFSIDQKLMISKCSNIKKKYKYENLQDSFQKIVNTKCPYS